jgi:RNA polymerase sigma factor (sigma-70 family)
MLVDADEEEREAWFRREVLPLEHFLLTRAKKYCRNSPYEPADLVNETFAKLVGLSGWRDVDNVQAFANRTLRNLSVSIIRHSKIVQFDAFADMDVFHAADEQPDALRIVEGRDDLRRVAKIISELPTQCRRVFTLKKIYELSHQEIADRLGLSVSTVEKHAIKALRLCQERLAAFDDLQTRVPNNGVEDVSRGNSGRSGNVGRSSFRIL